MIVKEAAYHKPINAEGGLYVHITDVHADELGEVREVANVMAKDAGYDPAGRTTVGFPVSVGHSRYECSIWYHQRATEGVER